ncbi:ABC transporter ATP-binding protein [Cellulomonas marina]|uniref:ABC-2 type transport system ATP-binding protein n=1 Tax=Cellulomonas marina TaxID=988821 RepID=A0A1I0XMV5_9CELL|nr:ABC transporter ATP-binding protein [Cellulomonas marina]GIG30608.1 ABC transporter [Cellulomonas marina]SFB01766.1 ABC-2 type transport system ATP-binding protein [Cellulomonas marina]
MVTTSARADAAVVVRGLTKHYGDKRAVDGLDLDVARGECVAVLGPNGAGKTTTVEVLEGYRRRDGGEVAVLGQDPGTAGRDWRTHVGIVLQSADDAAEATVGELVRQFARYYPDPRDPAEVVAAVGLQDRERTRVRRLSGGQRRRLDVALGIVGRPELLFLDEPTTGFDPQARHEFWDLVHRLRDEGTTVLLTTHYLEEAERLADRVVVVAAGRVVGSGTPAALGGRAARSAVVRWVEDGAARELTTDAPTRVVAELAARWADRGLDEVPGLEVRRPTLEDVYLRMIGEAAGTTDGLPAATGATDAVRVGARVGVPA